MRVNFQIAYHSNELTFSTQYENAKHYEYTSLENPQLKIFIKGIVLNEKDLIQSHAVQSQEELYISLYQKFGNRLTDHLRGEFSGFLFDKISNKLFVFTNLLGSQRVYYYQKNGILLVDTDLFSLKNRLKAYNLSFNLDLTAAYSILSLTNLIKNYTLIEEVKKLNSAEQLHVDFNHFNVGIEKINPLEDSGKFSGPKTKSLEKLHELFGHAVKLEYEFDNKIEKKHFSLLSGGLDSRMGIIYAVKQGFKPDESLCFSHSNYWDEKIAQEIAGYLQFPLRIVHLDGGEFIKDVDKITDITHGLTPYLGGVHSNFALEKIDFSDKGLIHSGHLGDAILGTYLSSPQKETPENGLRRLILDSTLSKKIEDKLIQASKEFETEELFLLHNRGFNLISTGIYVAENFSYQVSPFMNDEFIRFSLSLPEEWKFNQKIYIEWIRKHCKESTQFKWERTFLRPDKAWKTQFGINVLKRANNLIYAKILGKDYKLTMSPYEYYYKTNLGIREFYKTYFNYHIDLIGNSELKSDMVRLFQQGDFRAKSRVISLLSGYKKLFT